MHDGVRTAPTEARTVVVRIASGFALFAVAYALVAGRRVVHTDEAWFLWAARRVAHGEALYRDVYSVTTPIPMWIAAGAVRVLGTEVLVVRALSVACFVASVVMACAIAGRCGLGRGGRGLLVVALFVYASPAAHFVSVYSQLAVLMALITMWCLLVWSDAAALGDGRRRLLVGAGVAAGVALGSKTNVGVLVILGAVLLVWIAGQGRSAATRTVVRDVVSVAGAFGVVVAAFVVPVVVNGAWPAFVGDVIQEKANYVRLLGGDVPPGIAEVRHIWSDGTSLFGRFLATQSLVTVVTVGLVVLAIRRARRTRRFVATTLGVFTAVGVMAAYPQAGPQHLTEVMPLVLTVAASAVAVAELRPRRAHAALVGWCSLASVLLVGRAVMVLPDALTGEKPPHFAASAVSDTWPRQRQDLAELRQLTGGDVFIVRSDAAYFYLAGGLRDPTPYDFAARSDFGAADESGIAKMITRHEIRWVCIKSVYPPSHGIDVRPRKVEEAVRRELWLAAHLRTCDLYKPPPR